MKLSCVTLVLAAAVMAMPAQAQAHQARLMADDAPLASGAKLLPLAKTEGPVAEGTPKYVPHLGVTFVAAFVSIPTGFAVSNLLGTLSNNLIWAALPGLVAMTFIAPTITTLVSWLYGNWHASDGFKPFGFWLPWLSSLGVHIVSMVIAGFLGATIGVPATLFVMGAIEGLVMSGAVVGTMHLTERKREAGVAIQSFVPGVTETRMLSLAKVDL